MGKSYSFRFVDNDLNHELIRLLKKAKVGHSVDKAGVIHYSEVDGLLVQNDLICSIRDQLLPAWQILTCPPEWRETYRDYMERHHIPYREELSNGELWFLIDRRYRPHAWKLDDPTAASGSNSQACA